MLESARTAVDLGTRVAMRARNILLGSVNIYERRRVMVRRWCLKLGETRRVRMGEELKEMKAGLL
jgi:hypothetical protein